jgi:ferredoxin-thioredoxin reductase catalytic subunit
MPKYVVCACSREEEEKGECEPMLHLERENETVSEIYISLSS